MLNYKSLKFSTFYLGVTFINLDNLIPHYLCSVQMHDFHEFIITQTSQDAIYSLFIGLLLFLPCSIYGNGICVLISTFNNFPYICTKSLQKCFHYDFPNYKFSPIKQGWLNRKCYFLTTHLNGSPFKRSIFFWGACFDTNC